ncbi:glutathione S-transferase protein [Rutstroemia sp. NJR-2017a WRK4]|nr:glutathione S-transferase protein [Rutstroemia sp. NJR-2017a WRK4]
MASTAAVPASSEQPKIKLYWLNESRSHRLLWLLEVLKLPYELEILHRLDNQVAPPELKDLHPLGKAPVLTITPPHAEKSLVLVESAVIIE